MNWHRVVLDEAHYIKGTTSQWSRAAAELEGHFLWCLTGTPIQNNPSELYSLMRFLKVEPWNEWRYWNEHVLKGYRSGDADAVSQAEDCIRLLLQVSSDTAPYQCVGREADRTRRFHLG